MAPAINSTNEIQCFICFDSNESEPFIQGPFCPNEGDTPVQLNGIEGQVYITGRHGTVHQRCLDQSIAMNRACPVCRFNDIRPANQSTIFQHLNRIFLAPIHISREIIPR